MTNKYDADTDYNTITVGKIKHKNKKTTNLTSNKPLTQRQQQVFWCSYINRLQSAATSYLLLHPLCRSSLRHDHF